MTLIITYLLLFINFLSLFFGWGGESWPPSIASLYRTEENASITVITDEISSLYVFLLYFSLINEKPYLYLKINYFTKKEYENKHKLELNS